MASPLLAARLLVLCLLCGGAACAAAKRRYLSVSMDELLGGSTKKAHVDCPPWNKSGTAGQEIEPCMHLKLRTYSSDVASPLV